MQILDTDMKRYFAIYFCLLKLNYHRALFHKADFLNGLLSSILWGVFSIVAVYILTARSTSVFGWTRSELFVLTGVFNILVGGVFHMFFARNFDRFSHVIQIAELDSLLLKPFNSEFALSFWYISYHSIIRIILAMVYTFIVLSQAHIPVTFISTLSFLFLGILGIITLYAFQFLIMTSLIWMPDVYNLVELLFTVRTLSRYPPQILWSMRIVLFFVFFPLTLIVSVPTKALLHTVTSGDVMLLAGFSLVLLYCSHTFWKFALRYYVSAS